MNNMILRTLKNHIALSRACLEYDRYVIFLRVPIKPIKR